MEDEPTITERLEKLKETPSNNSTKQRRAVLLLLKEDLKQKLEAMKILRKGRAENP